MTRRICPSPTSTGDGTSGLSRAGEGWVSGSRTRRVSRESTPHRDPECDLSPTPDDEEPADGARVCEWARLLQEVQ